MRLLLMRHAHTHPSEDKPDIDRLLTKRGMSEAKEAAVFLCEYQVDKLLVSYAKRTMQTSKIIQTHLSVQESEIVTELYNEGIEAIIDLLAAQEDRNKHILVIGHNPLIYEVALLLSNPTSAEYDQLIATLMPPARVIIIDFPDAVKWGDIRKMKGNIKKIFTPSVV
ncbi:MAG: hypothetical protein COA94_07485 [Rickettsiales bacterium]|nr:MAG: hypothetical protein COA94_07485 [Rickettsiales bacterium]